MRYKLKKDLPFHQKGEVDIIIKAGATHYLFGITFYMEDLDKLIEEGWIEEVKPREWYLEVGENQVYVRDINLDRNGKPSQKLFSSGSEIIKVREVL